jgi:hypothetical protein
MPSLSAAEQQTRLRNLHFLREPKLWPHRPFLALMRRRPGVEEEYGVLYDALGASGRVGYSATVFLCNVFLLPATEAEFLALPKETFDTAEEIYQAGWRID